MEDIQEKIKGMEVGYKIMRLVDNKYAVSMADSRQRVGLTSWATFSMPDPGIYLSPSEQYVRDYYSGHNEEEVLLTLMYDPDKATECGSPLDVEREIIAKGNVVIVSWEKLCLVD